MKIAMVAGYYPPDIKGGGEISTQILAHILTAAGCDVHVLTCGTKDSLEDVDGIPVHRIVSPNLYWDFKATPSQIEKLGWHLLDNVNPRARKRVREFLKQTKPDLLLTSTIENFGSEAWNAAHETNIPSVHILRSYYPFCFRGNAVRNEINCVGQCIDCKLLSLGRRHASQQVTGVVGISRYVLSSHQSRGFFTKSATTVIGEPISRELFRAKNESTTRSRFGYLGVLSADKGLESLAEAWRKGRLEGCSLSIAGQGKQDYTDKIRGLFPPDVKFLGWVSSSEYLSNLDYLVVPSVWNEPFGRIVIEAFAKGVPVVGSRIGGIAETIVDSRNGYVFEPNDSDQLSKLLVRCSLLSVEEYRQLSESARLDVEQYESAAIAKAHVDFYAMLISRQRDECRAVR